MLDLNKTFIDRCMAGEADVEELDAYIEFWHMHDTGMSLREFLGLTPEEYQAYGTMPDLVMADILERRKKMRDRETTD